MKIISTKTRLPPVNWFGLVAGALMLVLPFLGPWWSATVGTGAMDLALSPFDYRISLLEQPISSTLVGYFLLAAKLSVIIGGALMIAGSLGAKRWWGRRLVRFGAMKVFWMVIGLIALLLVGAFFLNSILPSLLGGMVEEEVAMQLNVPYVTGATASTIQMGDAATVTTPITASLTNIFWVAVVTAALGVAARIYHRRFVKPEKDVKPEKLKKRKSPVAVIAIIVVIVVVSVGVYFLLEFIPGGNGPSGQTWIIEWGGQDATLTVDSSGNFTGSGWVGSAPGFPDYNIYITNGRMSGTSMTYEVSASYAAGQGTISGTGTGTLNAPFSSATSATGTIAGTISDPLGTRSFSDPWTATRQS